MECNMRYFIFCGLLLFLLPHFVFAKNPADLLGIEAKPREKNSHFVFILTKKTKGQVQYFPLLHQIKLKLYNARSRFKINPIRFPRANVTSFYLIEKKEGLHFIFIVKDNVKWTVQYLPGQVKNRIRFQLEIISVEAVDQKNTQQKIAQNAKKIFEGRITENLKKLSYSNRVNKKSAVFTIVIDAGHGGKDPGAIGKSGIKEKDIVLSIEKKLEKRINETPHMIAILTRDRDYFVSLRERLKRVRKKEADLFIAIHADAYFDKQAKGASVYALSKRSATSEAARWLALRDNYSELGQVQLDELQDNSLSLRSMLIDLAQTATVRESIRLGNKLLDAMDEFSSLHYKYVEQAPFMVLKSPDIPSVLVEVGFLSNSYEEARLSQSFYQEKIAEALWKGIFRYRNAYNTLHD